jgi:hypothetical protein
MDDERAMEVRQLAGLRVRHARELTGHGGTKGRDWLADQLTNANVDDRDWTSSRIYDLEAGRISFRVEYLVALAEIFDLEYGWFLGDGFPTSRLRAQGGYLDWLAPAA